MRDLLSRLQKDIEDQGELAAYYSTDGKDGNMAVSICAIADTKPIRMISVRHRQHFPTRSHK